MKSSLLEKKWSLLLKYIKRFKHIPFVDFVLVAGSMATGDIHKDSDFDLIIGSKSNRIFSTRFITAFFFQLDGSRRKNIDTKKQSKDKICLNHFVTKDSYKLNPPYNKFWINLYSNLVPVYGSKEKIESFFKENDWTGDIDISYKKYIGNKKSLIKKTFEFILSGPVGNLFERIVKKYQIKRIEKNLDNSIGYKPQIAYNDNELRFHMDTKRIEEYLESH